MSCLVLSKENIYILTSGIRFLCDPYDADLRSIMGEQLEYRLYKEYYKNGKLDIDKLSNVRHNLNLDTYNKFYKNKEFQSKIICEDYYKYDILKYLSCNKQNYKIKPSYCEYVKILEFYIYNIESAENEKIL